MPLSTPGAFDSVHTCDPSVVRVNGTMYSILVAPVEGAGPGGDRHHAGDEYQRHQLHTREQRRADRLRRTAQSLEDTARDSRP